VTVAPPVATTLGLPLVKPKALDDAPEKVLLIGIN
jgi:hypothetical protein